MGFYPARADYHDGVISVDQALKDPTIIENRVAEVASKNLLVETIFSTDNSPVEGGTVIYSKTTEKNFYTENDVSARQPGDEYTVVYREKPVAELARVEDYGGKFPTSDEALRRNNAIDFDNDVTALANTITRKLNQRVIETLDAAVDANETINLAVTDALWGNTILDGDPTTITPPFKRPTAHLADVFAIAESKDLGIEYTKLIVNPMLKATLRTIYGANFQTMLDSYGLDLISSNYVTSDRALLVDPGKAGFVKFEEPLTVKTWRDEEHRQTWTQGYAMPVMGVTLPAAVACITGIGQA